MHFISSNFETILYKPFSKTYPVNDDLCLGNKSIFEKITKLHLYTNYTGCVHYTGSVNYTETVHSTIPIQ